MTLSLFTLFSQLDKHSHKASSFVCLCCVTFSLLLKQTYQVKCGSLVFKDTLITDGLGTEPPIIQLVVCPMCAPVTVDEDIPQTHLAG